MATGKPWHLMQGGQLLEQPVAPTLISYDEVLELQAVLAGMVLGQLAGTQMRAFVGLAIERLSDCPQFVLTSKELLGAQRAVSSTGRRPKPRPGR